MAYHNRPIVRRANWLSARPSRLSRAVRPLIYRRDSHFCPPPLTYKPARSIIRAPNRHGQLLSPLPLSSHICVCWYEHLLPRHPTSVTLLIWSATTVMGGSIESIVAPDGSVRPESRIGESILFYLRCVASAIPTYPQNIKAVEKFMPWFRGIMKHNILDFDGYMGLFNSAPVVLRTPQDWRHSSGWICCQRTTNNANRGRGHLLSRLTQMNFIWPGLLPVTAPG